jgi:hypothetical protein
VAIESIVALAHEHGHKVILILSDHDGHCGDGGAPKAPAFYAGEYRTSFLPWVRTLAARLRDSPGVAMWEVAKQPIGVEPAVLRAFYDEVGGELHAIAPRHLVLSGTQGTFAYGGDAGYRLIHESPGIDVASFQDFNGRWGRNDGVAAVVRALGPVDKPLVIGSVAFQGSPTGNAVRAGVAGGCLSWATRVEAFRAKLTASFATPEVAGATIWNWMPRSRGACRLETYPDDPLMQLVRTLPLPGVAGP